MRTIFFGAVLVAALSFVTQSNAISLDDTPVLVPDYLSQIEVFPMTEVHGPMNEHQWIAHMESIPIGAGKVKPKEAYSTMFNYL